MQKIPMKCSEFIVGSKGSFHATTINCGDKWRFVQSGNENSTKYDKHSAKRVLKDFKKIIFSDDYYEDVDG